MNDRFKFRVWDIEEWTYLKCKYSKSAGYHKYTLGKHDVWHDIGYFIENNPKYYIIEQCTGLKDKNGNLIYEGDLLTDGRDTGHVLWRGSGWGCTAFLWKKKPETLEICGNIHEQAEQKDK